LSALTRLLNRFALVLLREDVSGQGRHIDPEDPATEPPAEARWTTTQRRANESRTMELFSDALRPPNGGSVRDGVLGDLGAYHKLTPAQVIDRCLRWEEASVEEWEAAPRSSPDGLAQFYDSVESWSFDLLWYAYLQSAGFSYPETVVVADRVGPAPARGRLLDLGSGVGVTAQLFASLGWEVTLADVSAPLLAFAQWRHEQRGVKATYLHLPADLPDGSYDLITALDVMAHVPDVGQTARRMHRALRPGGLFVANFDVRRRSARNAWHLYEDDLPLRWAVQRAGFVPVTLIDGILWIYRAQPTTGSASRLRHALVWARLASPPARAIRTIRRALARATLLTIYRVVGAKSQENEAETR
jgi:SAM-dependent methyltransferase